MRVVNGYLLNREVAEALAKNYPKNRDEIFSVWRKMAGKSEDTKIVSLRSLGPAKLCFDFKPKEFGG